MNSTREIIPGFKQPEVEFDTPAPQEVPVVIARLEKAMPELIHSTVALENNPMTFVEVKTMLDGVTVGGHKIEDSQQVLNQARSYKKLINRVRGQYFQPTQQELCGLHKVLAFEEALEWGAFRRGDVRIAGTGYRPPPAARLPGMYKTGMEKIRKHVQGPHLQAMCAFLLVSKLQCFWDGNKRAGRLLMNGMLLSAGQDAVLVSHKRKEQYNEVLLNFYDTGRPDQAIKFLGECVLGRPPKM